MAVPTIRSILAGLELSPTPHLLVQEDRIVGATPPCAELLGFESSDDLVGSNIQDWIIDYGPHLLNGVVAQIRHRAGTFFQAMVQGKFVTLEGRQIAVIAITSCSLAQLQNTANDLNLLSHVLNPALTQLHQYVEQHSLLTPRLRGVSQGVARSVEKFSCFRQLTNGFSPDSPSSFSLKELLLQCVQESRELYGAKWEISVQVSEAAAFVTLDKKKVGFILDEVIENAVIHNDQGKIEISLGREESPKGEYWVITIKDDGKGFDPQIVKKTPPGSPVVRLSNGTVGLAVCHGHVRNMRGELSIESEQGKGTIIRLKLPPRVKDLSPPLFAHGMLGEDLALRRVASAPVNGGSSGLQHGDAVEGSIAISGEKKSDSAVKNRVLVVDDNAINRKALSGILEKLGYQPTNVTDGEDAVKKIAENPFAFDLIFMDLLMVRMGGIEASKQIQAICQKKGTKIPIIACTANTQNDNECFAAGMVAVMHKPTRREHVKQLLSVYCPLQKSSSV